MTEASEALVWEKSKADTKSSLVSDGRSGAPETGALDRWDCAAAMASGVMTAALDVLWAEDISIENAHDWGREKIEAFVIKTARMQGYKGIDLAGAVRLLEEDFPIGADKLTNEFGGGKYHHLRDFSHHPTLIGLLFSILSQFTGVNFGTDVNGAFIHRAIPEWKKPDLLSGVYNGSIVWFFHMVSDVAGSSSSIEMVREGTGLPGPLLSLLKEFSSIPGIRTLAGKDENGRYNLSLLCSKLFQGTLFMEKNAAGELTRAPIRFDLRTELGIMNEAVKSKQYVPILINEGIVCSFYTLSRLTRVLHSHPDQTQQELQELDLRQVLPGRGPALRRMRMIASTTFTAVDMGSAGIWAYLEHKGDPGGFALCFLQRINYFGLIRLGMAGSAELEKAVSRQYGRFASLAEQQKEKLTAADPHLMGKEEVLKKAIATAGAVGKMGTPAGFVFAAIGVYDEVSKAVSGLKIAREERIRVEEECAVRVRILREYQAEMETVVESYLSRQLKMFGEDLDLLEQAAAEGDTDAFLQGNARLQEQLGRNGAMRSQSEFEAMMCAEGSLKL